MRPNPQHLHALLPDSPDRGAQAIDLRFDLRLALLQEAVALAEAGHDQQRLGLAYSNLITHFLNIGDPGRALDIGQRALALAEELGMRPLQAHCQRGLGTLYARQGQRQQAHAALATAIDLYRDMEMTFWLPQAEAALARVETTETRGKDTKI